MAKKAQAVGNADVRFGIRVSYIDGRFGWIVGADCDYLLFDSEADAEKALKKMKKDTRYSWNCVVEVRRFQK